MNRNKHTNKGNYLNTVQKLMNCFSALVRPIYQYVTQNSSNVRIKTKLERSIRKPLNCKAIF